MSAWALAEEDLGGEGEVGTQVLAVRGGSWRVTPAQLLCGAGEARWGQLGRCDQADCGCRTEVTGRSDVFLHFVWGAQCCLGGSFQPLCPLALSGWDPPTLFFFPTDLPTVGLWAAATLEAFLHPGLQLGAVQTPPTTCPLSQREPPPWDGTAAPRFSPPT